MSRTPQEAALTHEWTPERIRALRHRLGLTQVQLAARLGCTRAAVQHWEYGRRQPNGIAAAAFDHLEEEDAMSPQPDLVACRRTLARALERAYRAETTSRATPPPTDLQQVVIAEAVAQARVSHRRDLEQIARALDGDERTIAAAAALSQIDPDPIVDLYALYQPAPGGNDARRDAILAALADPSPAEV